MADQKRGKEPGVTTLGPIDLLVLEFPVNNFDGEILRNLYEQVAAGTIRIIDLVLISKNQEGNISAINLHDLGPEANRALFALHATVNQMLTMEDIDAISENLALNSSAGILLYENVWAIKTKQAMLNAGGRFLIFERIPEAVIQQAVEDMAVMSEQLA